MEAHLKGLIWTNVIILIVFMTLVLHHAFISQKISSLEGNVGNLSGMVHVLPQECPDVAITIQNSTQVYREQIIQDCSEPTTSNRISAYEIHGGWGLNNTWWNNSSINYDTHPWN